MNTIYIRYEGLSPSWSGDAVTGQIGTLRCSFEFDESWDGYETKYMVVARENTIFDPVELDETNSAYVPEIAIRERCYLKIGAVGLCKGETTKRYNGRPCRVAVDQGNLIPDPNKEPDENGSETAYEQIILQLMEKLDKNQGAENAGRMLVVGEDGVVVPGEAKESVELDTTLTESGKAADAKAVGDALANISGDGLSSAEKNLILSLFKNAAYTANMSATVARLETLWSGGDVPDIPDVPVEPDIPDTPTVTLTSISATYSGGAVAVGTALTALTGIVVTATYSDGSTAAVTGYTLSGTIADGSNTITVSYGGKTATITVTGVAEPEVSGVFQTGDILSVVSGVTITQSGSILEIA